MSSWEEEEGEVEEEIWQRGAGHCYRRSQWPRRTHQLSAPLPAATTIPFSLLLSQQSGSCSHASMTPLTRRLIAQNDASPSDFFKLKLTRCHFLYIVQQCNPHPPPPPPRYTSSISTVTARGIEWTTKRKRAVVRRGRIHFTAPGERPWTL